MEFNPSNESETLHFSPSKEEEEEEEEEGGLREKGTKMGFIWDKGLSLGKKLVVTGFVVSSLPLLLPPLIVVSAIGLTLSLPFGFVYASYRCTEKLMSKLLPSQVVIDPATVPLPHESEDLDNGGTVEEIQGPGDLEKDVKTSRPAAEEKDDELMEKESEKHVADRKSVGAENPEELDKKHQAEDIRENISGLAETEKGGKKGIWGKLKPSRKRKGHAGEDKKLASSSQESKTSSSDMLSTEAVAEENPANERMEIPREEEPEVARDCIKSEGSDMGCLESSGEVEVGEEGGGEEQQENKPLVLKTNSENNEQSEMAISDDSKHSLDDSALVEVPELKNEQDVARDSIKSKGTDRGSLESSTAEGEVKVTEGGGEEQQEKKPLVLKTNSENNEQSKMVLSDDSKHSLDEAALVAMPELKKEEAHHLKGDRTVSDADSVEGTSEDEKIWRKIDLIRAIVGFKTPRHPSYFEELKALYAFTGIELPPLDEDPSDLTEFNNKLHFLMSVIGVK